MATGAKLTEEKEWLREAIGEYIEEEMGHQEWILNDLAACGVDKNEVRYGQPAPATELMVAYAFDAIAPFTPENGLLTQTGKVKRDDVITHYSCTLAALYSTSYFISHAENSVYKNIISGE